MATFKVLVATFVALAMTAAVQAEQYMVSWSYDNAACDSPASYGSFAYLQTCSATACDSQVEITCANDMSEVIPSDGSKGKFMVFESFTGSSCSGNSVGGQFFSTDICIEVPGGYTYYTCSGGKAIVKGCTDSACGNCITVGEESTDTCIAANGGSGLYHCSLASSMTISAAAVFVVALAAVFSVTF